MSTIKEFNENLSKPVKYTILICILLWLGMILADIYGCKPITDPIPKAINNNLSYGMGFYLTHNQIDSETALRKFHIDCFIGSGTLRELLWMGKAVNGGHQSYNIIVMSGFTDTLWVSPLFITGYIECERQEINKSFDKEIEIFIKTYNTKYPIELYITTIVDL